MKRRIIPLVLFAALMMTGCGSGEEFSVQVKNLTGVAISEIQIAPETDQASMKNMLKEELADGAEITLSLGRLTEEDIRDGFALLVYNAEDGSSQDFGMLMLSDGDTVSFYLDDLGLAVGVNMTEEEIEEEKERLRQDVLSSAADEE